MFLVLKTPSHYDGSFEYPQHMFRLRNKKQLFGLKNKKKINPADLVSTQDFGTYIGSI